jgi:hypothetical protein
LSGLTTTVLNRSESCSQMSRLQYLLGLRNCGEMKINGARLGIVCCILVRKKFVAPPRFSVGGKKRQRYARITSDDRGTRPKTMQHFRWVFFSSNEPPPSVAPPPIRFSPTLLSLFLEIPRQSLRNQSGNFPSWRGVVSNLKSIILI